MPRFRSAGAVVERHWQQLASRRRLYTIGGLVLLLLALSGSLWFANETNAGKFFDRLPYVFDFFIDLKPRDWFDPVRALFDLPSPYDDGSLKFDYPDGRVYVAGSFYIPEYFYQMLETLNIALFSTLIGFTFGFLLCFFAARNMTTSRWLRFATQRVPRNRARLSRDRDCRLLPGDLLAGADPGDPRGQHPYGRRARQDVLRGRRERRHEARRRPARRRRQLGRARLVRHRAAGAAELHELLPAALRDQRAGLDHHRRGRRRRHRRGAAPVDQPRPRGQDHRHRLPAVFAPSSPSTSSRPGCAAAWSASQAFDYGRGA